jgi:hypothetical protein
MMEKSTINTNLCKNIDMYKVNHHSTNYYAYDIASSGKKFLISQMWCSQVGLSQEMVFKSLSDRETEFQILFSKFVTGLTRTKQKELAGVMNGILDLYIRQKKEVTICQLPQTLADVRRMYIDGEFAITRHLPVPKAIKVEDHSFVSVAECVADFLLRVNTKITDIYKWENTVDKFIINSQMHLFRSRRIQEARYKGIERIETFGVKEGIPIITLFIKFWSDDFDPNKSIKANRQSVWIKTCTIFAMDNFGKKIQETYPISLSFKGSNHEIIEEKIASELQLLKSGKLQLMYSRAHKSQVYVHAELYCVLNDQPERRGNLHLSNGNSIVHSRFGYIIDCNQVKEEIRSCKNCSSSIISEINQKTNLENMVS